MDAEFREAFAKISSQLSDVGRDAKQAVTLTKEMSHDLTKVKSDVKAINGNVIVLNKAVFGTDNPPTIPPNDGALVRKVSNSDLEVDSVKANLIILSSEVDSIKKLNETQSEEISQIKSAIVGFTGKITSILNNPKVIAIGRFAFASIMAYAVAKGWAIK
jgi:hypothetical protein